ncbi:sensor histidine kinase [Cryptosporangium minutisporangium]|uniref:Oxygen sensor histidine kinase NreB n=1 Tax=Cryptosporangium minutisporangium TaxID=113569 RepID=A0ABP6T332_9ACTN
MSAVATPPADRRVDRWEARVQAGSFYVAPYVGLAVGTVLFLAVGSGDARSTVITLGLLLTTIAWITGLATLNPHAREPGPLMAVYFVGLLLLLGVLIWRSPWFGFGMVVGYVHGPEMLPTRWIPVGVAATAALTATSQAGGFGPAFANPMLYAIAIVFNILIAGGFTLLGWLTYQQGLRRDRMLADLSEAHRQLAETMEENAGLHAQLLVQAREAGVLDERERMAREIHDTLAQGLTGIITQLQAAEQSTDAAAREHHVATAIELARESLSEARRSVRAMRPEPLEDAGLVDALGHAVTRWSGLSGVPAQLVVTGIAVPLPPDVEVVLLRTAQEALANAAKHASAHRVGLTLSYMDDEVALDVRDDGVGFDVDAPLPPPDGRRGGFGLTAMRERVESLAGTLEVESTPGAGTALSARLPLSSEEPDD